MLEHNEFESLPVLSDRTLEANLPQFARKQLKLMKQFHYYKTSSTIEEEEEEEAAAKKNKYCENIELADSEVSLTDIFLTMVNGAMDEAKDELERLRKLNAEKDRIIRMKDALCRENRRKLEAELKEERKRNEEERRRTEEAKDRYIALLESKCRKEYTKK